DFTNTAVALRNQIEKYMTFKEILLEMRQTCSEAVENQGYPLEILIEELGLSFKKEDFPLFDVAVMVENIHEKSHLDAAAPAVIFCFSSVDEIIACCLEYDSSLYAPATAGRIMSHFMRLLQAVLDNVEIKLSAVDILSEEEKKKLLYDINDTETSYPKNKTIQALFEEQVERYEHSIALAGAIHGGRPGKHGQSTVNKRISLSYRQLSREVHRLAGVLIQKGVTPDTIVGLLVERSLEMITAIFGILKAGGAYLPIEPHSPQARKLYMLKESKTSLLLTTSALIEEIENLDNLEVEKIYIEDCRDESLYPVGTGGRGGNPLCRDGFASLAYIIYTSGTTGNPKGILTMHYNVIRVVKDTNYIDFKSADKVLQLSNYAFDGSVFDIYGALLNGAALVLVDEEKVLAPDKLADLIRQEKVTVFFVTTALFNALVELKIECFQGVRKVLFGGERVSVEHSKKALEYMGKGRILHVYGPTESTVYAAYYPIDRIAEKDITIPIGRPIANTSLYVLDKDLQLLPMGVQGELYIGGDGLARGYLNNPELTAGRFASGGQGAFLKNRPLHPQKTFDKSFCGSQGGSFLEKRPLAA
ncbi:MAG: AMP-binding protein, partial [Candidatus Aminicenantes bacterium]|nr:AMP-binding protein [Candidatus Aminicenantes bacterium]